MDTLALNYDNTANVDDGSCTFSSNLGCTDSTATNYDITATVDDGSCTYPIPPMVNLFFSEYAEGSSSNKYLEIYNPTSDTVDLTHYAFPNVSNDPTTAGVYEYWNDFPAGAIILPNDVYIIGHPYSDVAISGVADYTYTYLSNGDDGFALVYGSNPGSPVDPTTGGYVIVDFIGDWNGDPGSGWSVAGVADATKDHTLLRKCDVTQGNDDWTASAGTDAVNSEWIVMPVDDWSDLGLFNPCTSINYGCTDLTADNYDSTAVIDDGSCTYAILGCTDPTACNYDPAATVDDGSCVSLVATSYLINAGNYYYTPSNLSINVGDTVTWFNDGGYHDVNGDVNSLTGASFNNPIAFSLPAVSGPSVIGSYIFTVAGTYNYDCSIGSHAANGMVGSIVVNTIAVGCTDSTAVNYNPTAVCDDGSCTYTILGCTDPTASNYDASATQDDDSCYNLVWEEPNTGANATIAITPEGPNNVSTITFNGGEFPVGAYLGVFFTDDNGQYSCGGMEEWTGINIAMAAWGDDTQTAE